MKKTQTPPNGPAENKDNRRTDKKTSKNPRSSKLIKDQRLSGTELFSLFTADIIKEKVLFTR